MKSTQNVGADPEYCPPIEYVSVAISGAVASVEMDGTEDYTRTELRALFMDFAATTYLQSDEACVTRIISSPDLLMVAECVRGYRIFAHKRQRLAMVDAEIARLEIDRILSEN